MYNATLVNRIDITPELIIIQVKPDAPISDFLPGQYVALGLLGSEERIANSLPEQGPVSPDKIIKRAYSIGSSPQEKEHLEFYIAIVPEGALSSRLAVLKPGARLFAAQKITGTFTIESVPEDHHLVFVATGTGIAPFVSMLRTVSTWKEKRKLTLIHGVRYPQDLAYREELESLMMKARGIFQYVSIASRADESYQGLKGRVQKVFDEKIVTLDPALDHVFLCGNPAMIDELEKSLTEQGYTEHSRRQPGNLHLERYW